MAWKEERRIALFNGSADGFKLFITVDQNISYQQNIERLPVIIVVLRAKDNRRETLSKLVPKVFERLAEESGASVIEISE